MTQQWYRAYQVYGSPEQILEQVSHEIRHNDLSDFIPRLCFERPNLHKRRKEFYLFLGINSGQKGQIPTEIETVLSLITRRPHIGDFDFAEIKTMVSSEIMIEDYSRKIHYLPPPSPQFEDVFDGYNESLKSAKPTFTFGTSLNQLLYWLSAKRQGSWQQFKQVYQALGLHESGWEARQIFRHLRLLGHVESIGDGQNWVIAPPCLVKLSHADNEYYYALAGQRTPKLLTILEKFTTLNIEPQAHQGAPDCVQLRFNTSSEAQRLIENSEIKKVGQLILAEDASYRLTTLLPDIDGYQATLRPISGLVLSKYEISQWLQHKLNPVSLPEETGLYHLKSPNFQINLFYDAHQGQWLQGDWYGLRFLALHHAGYPCEVTLRIEEGQVALPVNYRWPDWYERALVLASCQLPEKVGDWLYFRRVSSWMANNLAQKLTAIVKTEQDDA